MPKYETADEYLHHAKELHEHKPIDAYAMDTDLRIAEVQYLGDISKALRHIADRIPND